MYKKLFGDIIDSKRKKIDGKCKYNYSINNDSIILDKKLFEIRKNISDKVKFVEDSEKENESIIFDLDI